MGATERVAEERRVWRPDDLVDAGPALVLRLDPDDLRVTFASSNSGWILGYRADELVESAALWEEVLHPDDRGKAMERLRRGMADVVAQIEQEYRCRGRDGRYRWFSFFFRLEYDRAADPIAIVAYAEDVTERKAMIDSVARAHDFLDTIVENLPNAVTVKDARTLRYVRVNRAAEELFDVAGDVLLGHTDADVFPPELAQVYEQRDRDVVSHGAALDTPDEIVATRASGPRVVHTRRIPLADGRGRVQYILGIAEDVTARRAAHEDVRLARLEAERASRAKSDFLSRMSHDLRTPLNAVLGFAQMLSMDVLSAEQIESLQQIRRAGSHLLDLINEVLDIARIEAGRLSLSEEPVAVAGVVSQVVDLMRPLAAPRGITVSAPPADEGDPYVRADRQRLKQVLLNLVGNAVKYNRDGGDVRISWQPSGGSVRIVVTDTGAGIARDKLALLFQPFERLGADQSAIEGTGLGLAVSKGLTEAMGGRIGVESEVDRGATFWIDMPRCEAPAPRPASEPRPASTSQAGQATGVVLYVEDNRSNVRLLERLMARRPGVRLVTAPTGGEALELVRAQPPDLVLLDLHLPDMPGEEVLRRLWADPRTRAIDVAVLSADATSSQQQRLLAAGAIAYLTKPLDLAVLLALLDERLPGGSGKAAARADAGRRE